MDTFAEHETREDAIFELYEKARSLRREAAALEHRVQKLSGLSHDECLEIVRKRFGTVTMTDEQLAYVVGAKRGAY